MDGQCCIQYTMVWYEGHFCRLYLSTVAGAAVIVVLLCRFDDDTVFYEYGRSPSLFTDESKLL